MFSPKWRCRVEEECALFRLLCFSRVDRRDLPHPRQKFPRSSDRYRPSPNIGNQWARSPSQKATQTHWRFALSEISGRICQPFGQSHRKGKFAAALERNHDQPTSGIIASCLRNRSTRHCRRTACVRCFKLIFSNYHESTVATLGVALVGPS